MEQEVLESLSSNPAKVIEVFDSTSFDMDCENGVCTLGAGEGTRTFWTWESYEVARALETTSGHLLETETVDPGESLFEAMVDWAESALVDVVDGRSADSRLLVSLALEELEDGRVDFGELSGLPTGERQSLIQDRRNSLAAIQLEAEEYVTSLGGVVHSRAWLTNELVVEISAGMIDQLRSTPRLKGIFPDTGHIVPIQSPPILPPRFNGDSARTGTRAISLLNSGGYDGSTGGVGGGRIRIGILEFENGSGSGRLICNSYNFLRPGGGRLMHAGLCDTTCSPNGQLHPDVCVIDGPTHASSVTQIAAGSIEHGLHPSFLGQNTLEQRQRSGVLPEAEIYVNAFRAGSGWWGQPGWCGAKNGIESLVEQEVDVINLSFADEELFCELSANPCGVAETLAAANSAGVILVGGAGHWGHQSGCRVPFPASHTDVVSVGFLNTPDHNDPSLTPYDYRASVRDNTSGRGQVPLKYCSNSACSSISTTNHRLVDLLAPGEFEFLPSSEVAFDATGRGSSLAAPAISGIAGQTRQWLADIGALNAANNPGRVQNHLFLYGDAFTGSSINPDVYLVNGVHNNSGFGRVLGFWRHSSSLGSWWSYRNRERNMVQGEVYEFPMVNSMPVSTAFAGGKVVMSLPNSLFSLFGEYFTHNFSLRVVDRCPPSGGVELIQAASLTNMRKQRIQLKNPADQLHGRCPYVQVTANSLIQGSSAPVYINSILYSASPDLF